MAVETLRAMRIADGEIGKRESPPQTAAATQAKNKKEAG
jgi:hypothetical protein